MPKTPKLGLDITTDLNTLFTTWQKMINGQGDGTANNPKSNMQILDDVCVVNITASVDNFPATGYTNQLYVDSNTNRLYRWNGTEYVLIGAATTLGETENTAYRGDRGKAAYDHSQASGNPHNTTANDIEDLADVAKSGSYDDLINKPSLDNLCSVHEAVSTDNFPVSGQAGQLYIDTSTNNLYRWNGTAYVMVGAANSGSGNIGNLDGYATQEWVMNLLSTYVTQRTVSLVTGNKAIIISNAYMLKSNASNGDTLYIGNAPIEDGLTLYATSTNVRTEANVSGGDTVIIN